jgi:hypothetical protein
MLWLLLGYVYILISFFVLYIGLPVMGITVVGYVQRSWARRYANIHTHIIHDL